MCGIAGLCNLRDASSIDRDVLRGMTNALSHRGPDDESYAVDEICGFGFRRLSIIDLHTGRQPMTNETGDIWVMLNGEIYNYIDLRTTLLSHGHRFRTASDTEVIVHAYETYGLEFPARLRGMFAIALWDKPHRRLVLVRDRMGKKPILYSLEQRQLAFASELKALCRWPHLRKSLSARAFHDYLSLLYIQGSDSIFTNVHKVPPASLLVCERGVVMAPERYWHPPRDCDGAKSFQQHAEALRSAIDDAVRIRLRSDVPLGAFLSGGIDSSIVVGSMARQNSSVNTVCIGFPQAQFDERPYAAVVAGKWGTRHADAVMDPLTFQPDDFIKLVRYMDEPFADSSFVPMYWAAMLARRQVTVALSGDGGDELFGGYQRYRALNQVASLARLPDPMLRALTWAGKASSPLGAHASLLRKAGKAAAMARLSNRGWIADANLYFTEEQKHALYSKAWREHLPQGYTTTGRMYDRFLQYSRDMAPVEIAMRDDLENSLVDDMLTKVDRASMGASLEVRSPFLDHEVVEAALRIPVDAKVRGSSLKVILKACCSDLLPGEIARRGKQGFELPIGHICASQPWRDYITDLVSPESISRAQVFDTKGTLGMRDDFLRSPNVEMHGLSVHQRWHRMWMVMVFLSWREQFMETTP